MPVIFGCVALVIGLNAFARAWHFRTHSTRTTGRVVAINNGDADGVTTFHPVVAFTNSSGILVTQQSGYGSSSFTFKPGDEIAIRYDSTAPVRVEVDSFQSVWMFPVIVTGLGIFFIVGHYRWMARQKLKTSGGATGAISDPPIVTTVADPDYLKSEQWKDYVANHYPEPFERLQPWTGLGFLSVLAIGIFVGYRIGHPAICPVLALAIGILAYSLAFPIHCPKCKGAVSSRVEESKQDDEKYRQIFHDCPNCRITWVDKKVRI